MLLLLALFLILEHVHIFPMHYMQSPIDRTIPFTAQFVWPYLVWFPYIVFSFFWFSTKDRDEYMRMTKMILFGWAAFLIFSFFYPTTLSLRPSSVGSGKLPSRTSRKPSASRVSSPETPGSVSPNGACLASGSCG